MPGAGFEFAGGGRLRFGPGVRADLAGSVGALGRRALLVTGADPARWGWAREALASRDLLGATVAVSGEPTLARVEEAVRVAREAGCDVVAGVGGGSALDAAKAVAGLCHQTGGARVHLEIVGEGRALAGPVLPVVAVPATAGTGSEVTRNAVITVPEHRVKVSLRSPLLLPAVALVDPELTRTVPPDITAWTGMDALTQVLEPFLSPRANPVTDALCRDALGRVGAALPAVVARGDDLGARTAMCLMSVFGGIALSNAGLGAVHGLAGPLGGRYGAPHGALCAALLGPVLQANLAALRRVPGGEPAVERIAEAARRVTGDGAAGPEALAAWVVDLVRRLGIPRLAGWGVDPADHPAIARQAAAANSMRTNPVPLSAAELEAVLAAA